MENRKGTADLIKGFAVLCMIQVHITEVFAKQYIYENTFGQISLFFGGPPAAPIFMAVMGYFVFLSKKDIYDQLTRGFLLFCGGIFLNIALNFHLLYHNFTGTSEVDPYKFILGVDILALAGLSIIILSSMKYFWKNSLYPYMILAFLIIIFTPIVNSNYFLPPLFQAFIGGEISWSYFPLIPWIIYPLIGFIFGILQMKKIFLFNKKYSIPLVLITFLIITSTFNFAYPISYNLEKYYHHGMLFALWVTGFLIVALYIFDWINKFNNPLLNYIKWIGKNVTAFYVIQWVIIGNIGSEIYRSAGYWEMCVWFFVVVIVTTIGVYLYNWFSSPLSTDPRLQENTQQ